MNNRECISLTPERKEQGQTCLILEEDEFFEQIHGDFFWNEVIMEYTPCEIFQFLFLSPKLTQKYFDMMAHFIRKDEKIERELEILIDCDVGNSFDEYLKFQLLNTFAESVVEDDLFHERIWPKTVKDEGQVDCKDPFYRFKEMKRRISCFEVNQIFELAAKYNTYHLIRRLDRMYHFALDTRNNGFEYQTKFHSLENFMNLFDKEHLYQVDPRRLIQSACESGNIQNIEFIFKTPPSTSYYSQIVIHPCLAPIVTIIDKQFIFLDLLMTRPYLISLYFVILNGDNFPKGDGYYKLFEKWKNFFQLPESYQKNKKQLPNSIQLVCSPIYSNAIRRRQRGVELLLQDFSRHPTKFYHPRISIESKSLIYAMDGGNEKMFWELFDLFEKNRAFNTSGYLDTEIVRGALSSKKFEIFFQILQRYSVMTVRSDYHLYNQIINTFITSCDNENLEKFLISYPPLNHIIDQTNLIPAIQYNNLKVFQMLDPYLTWQPHILLPAATLSDSILEFFVKKGIDFY